jgi:hypothetical protein
MFKLLFIQNILIYLRYKRKIICHVNVHKLIIVVRDIVVELKFKS